MIIQQKFKAEKLKESEAIPAVAIKMFPKEFVPAYFLEKKRKGTMQGILNKYQRNGILTKLSLMFIILGKPTLMEKTF